MARPRKYPYELRERTVRLVFESKRPIAQSPEIWASTRKHFVSGSDRRRPIPVASAIC
jgi:hypothetical protein